MIQVHDIHKSFDTLEVLKGINLEVQQGEVISIVGASGAGKTTLLQIIGTLLHPDTGSIHINNIDVTALSERELAHFRNQHIGFVFQFHNLLPEFTALENVCMPALIKGVTLDDAKKKAMKLLQFLNVAQRAEHKPSEL